MTTSEKQKPDDAGLAIFWALPVQILLTNLLTYLPIMTISSDNMNPCATEKPANWNLPFIRRFRLTFGLLSSVFDYLSAFRPENY